MPFPSPLRHLPPDERPRERMMIQGPQCVTNAELLAILLRTGCLGTSVLSLAQRLLVDKGGLLGIARCGWEDFVKIDGIGHAKALHLVAACELGRRVARSLPDQQPSLSSAEAIVQLVMEELRFAKQENFLCLFLNTRYRLLSKRCLFRGSVDATLVHPRDIFREAVRCNATLVVCVHNHPSGDPEPSEADFLLTCRLQEAGELMGIPLFDHIVIGDCRYVSFRERNLLAEVESVVP
ncbi:RadC family protein [Pasteuria penetrans]|uniref:RadC family protein n=1 Tax=Pasteuria penetrans TaxID=86005 RepID=UPI000F9976A7|nr:DNA repair protein RadC [Pasteuria penetrans]